MPVRFTESPLSVYDTEEWDPLGFLVDEEPLEDVLDTEFVCIQGELTSRTLSKYGIQDSPRRQCHVDGREVGDDRVDYSRDPSRLATGLVVQETVLGMKTSDADTFISNRYWNFCEVTSSVPSSIEESFDFARKTNTFQNLGYVDVPPLRIILDVMKGDRSHSSTAPGKAAMLGARIRTPRTEFLQGLHLASFLQDGHLRTSRSTEPKYLPSIMGGSAVRALFENPDNILLSVHAYRGGEYQRVYGTATRELYECVRYLNNDIATMPVFSLRLRDKQEYLHGTYAEKVFIPSRAKMAQVMGSLPPPLFEATGGANRFAAFENRLIRTKHLVTRTTAIREHEFATRVREQILSAVSLKDTDAALRLDRARARAEFGNALHANSAFKNLLDRNATIKDVQALTNSEFLVVNTGVTRFTKYDSDWLFNGGRVDDFSIDDLTSSEDMFLRSDVSEEETFKVGGLFLKPIGKGHIPPQMTSTKVGLYQINNLMTEWAEDLTSRLLAHRTQEHPTLTRDVVHSEFWKDPEWVNDDRGLIAKAIVMTQGLHYRSSRVALISDDNRLGNQMSQTCNCTVLRIPPEEYILYCIERQLDWRDNNPDPRDIEFGINNRGRKDPVRGVLLDTGSLSAAAARLQEGDGRLAGRIVKRTLISTGVNDTGQRYTQYTLSKTDDVLRMRCKAHAPIALPKKFLTGGTGRVPAVSPWGGPASTSRSSNAGSWRS